MIDQRAFQEEKILPPEPLPYVSRRALKRCKDAMQPPNKCNICGYTDIKIVGHADIYGGREYGDWPYAYQCQDCGSYVGIHKDTDLPLGTLADSDLRHHRKRCKHYFIQLLESKGWNQNAGYDFLHKKMEIEKSDCHFGMFDQFKCEQAAIECIKELGWHDELEKFY